MALSIQKTSPFNKKVLSSLVLALALIAQPMYAFVAQHVEAQDGITTVTQQSRQGWLVYGTQSAASHTLDSSAPVGAGALKMNTPDDSQYVMVWKTLSAPQPAADFTANYTTKRLAGPAHAAPAFAYMVDRDGDSSTNDTFYAIYEPDYNGGANYDNWNTWQLSAGSRFWYTPAHAARPAEAVNYTPLSDLLTHMPNATVRAVSLNMGTGNANWSALVDTVNVNGQVYDFDSIYPTPTYHSPAE